jgi:hypothetical protein
MPAEAKTPSRESRSRKWLTISMALGGIVGGLVGLFSALGLKPTAWAAAGLSGAVIGLTFWFAWKWWQALDEAAREAHKTGWYWGGTAGMMASMVLFCGLNFADPALDLSRYAMVPGDAGLVLTGIAVTVSAQVIGYIVVWAGWWWMRGR